MQKYLETKIELTIKHTKPIGEMTDLVSGRVYTMDGVEDVTAAIVEDARDELSNFAKDSFDELIARFNQLYKLDNFSSPTMRFPTRAELLKALENFKSILQEEVNECDDICKLVQAAEATPTQVLTDLADWLGDIMVYCASEMRKYGIRSDDILRIIMASNFSKLGPDGKPIYDERGKVMKGPNYWQPESMIERCLKAQIRQAEKASSEPHGY